MTIRIPVSADFNSADAEKAINKLNEQLNRLSQTVAGANRVQFNPVSAGSLDELKKIEARFKELTKISGGLRERMKATGQSGSSFGGLDWNRLYEDPAIRARKMHQAFQHVTAGSRYQVGGPAVPPPGAPPPPHQQDSPGRRSSGAGGVLSGIAGAGLRATGPVGGVVANAASAGMSGGMGAGMMGLLGGLAALAVGKGVAAIKGKVDVAGQEGIGYDTLKRTLGDVNVSFVALRGALRAASDNIDVTFEQAQKLGAEFAKTSGGRFTPKELAEEISVGGGFGRSFGMDPSESNNFFAQQRQFGTTSDLNGSRKMALMIGEAVAKSGSFGKADELMSAIASYTATQARNGLAAPNVAGYSGMLAGMVGSKIPGMDPQGAAALLSRVNGSIAGGGSSGEAGQNFLFNVLGSKHGLDPVQAMLLQQQGSFGTGRGAFGSQLYKNFTKKFGGGVSGSAANSDETNLSAILGGIKDRTNGNSSLMLNATARTLGINETQAMALHTIDSKDLTGMTGRMGRLGLDLGSLSHTGISALGNIESGDAATLKAQGDALRNRDRNKLSADDLKRLKSAEDEGNVEKLKDILTELTYSREQETTEGSKTRESIQGVDKRIQELATHLVPAANAMRDALILIAGGGKMGATGIAIAVAEAESNERRDNQKVEFDANMADQAATIRGVGVNDGDGALGKLNEETRQKLLAVKRSDPEGQSKMDKIVAESKKDRDALLATRSEAQKRQRELIAEYEQANKTETKTLADEVAKIRGKSTNATVAGSTKKAFEEKYGSVAEQIGKDTGVDKKLILGLMGHETGWGKSIIPGSNNLGNVKGTLGGGVTATDNQNGSVDSYNKYSSKEAFGKSYAAYLNRRFPNAMNTGSDGKKFVEGMSGYAEDPNWGNGVIRSSNGLFSTPMPEGHDASTNKNPEQKVVVEGRFTLDNKNGSRAAPPITTKTVVGAPRASGV